MRRALTTAITSVAFAALAAFAGAQERTHVRDVRVGTHPGYDRVVIELDGNAEIAWERGPEPNQESFYLDADLGRRERIVSTKLPNVGSVTLTAMRVGTHVSLEPRERRVRAYLLAKPTRLVIDLAAPGPEEFAAPQGVTPLAPATSIGSLKNAPIPEPKAEPAPEPEGLQPEPQREPEPAPEAAREPSHAKRPVTPEARAEPVDGAVEGAAEAPPAEAPPAETPAPEAGASEPATSAEPGVTPGEAPGAEAPSAAEAAPEPTPETAQPESQPEVATAPEPVAALPIPPAPEVTREPAAPEGGFPWLVALAAVGVVAAVGVIAFKVLRPSEEAPLLVRAPARVTASRGAEGISREEVRLAADTTDVLEQRLDQEARARVALEERLSEASEELKVLRDRLNRVERKREEAP